MMRRKLAVLGFAAALLGGSASVTAVLTDQTQAATVGASFIVPANDGYGIADCVASGSTSCGQVIADAWCEAQGFARSASYGPADVEVTGAISSGAGRPIAVTCSK